MIDLDPFILQENNRPLDDFQGLTPAEMHCLLYQPLSDNCVVRLKPSIADDVLDQIPFFRLLEDFMTLIENNRGVVKLTRTGALPRFVLEELYGKGHIPDESIEKGISKLNRESKSSIISTVRITAKEMGLIKKRHNRLSLTKKSEKLRRDRSALLKELLHFFAEDFNWGYNDLYPFSQWGNSHGHTICTYSTFLKTRDTMRWTMPRCIYWLSLNCSTILKKRTLLRLN